MGPRRKNDGILHRTDSERVGELVECKWIHGLCLILDFEIKKYYTIYEVYHFDTHEKYWVDEEDLEKIQLSA